MDTSRKCTVLYEYSSDWADWAKILPCFSVDILDVQFMSNSVVEIHEFAREKDAQRSLFCPFCRSWIFCFSFHFHVFSIFRLAPRGELWLRPESRPKNYLGFWVENPEYMDMWILYIEAYV